MRENVTTIGFSVGRLATFPSCDSKNLRQADTPFLDSLLLIMTHTTNFVNIFPNLKTSTEYSLTFC